MRSRRCSWKRPGASRPRRRVGPEGSVLPAFISSATQTGLRSCRRAKLVLAILEMARERRAESAGRAEALAESANHALDLIRDARRAAAIATVDPSRLCDDHGFRRD